MTNIKISREAIERTIDPARASTHEPVRYPGHFEFFARSYVGFNFVQKLADTWASNGYTDTRQVNEYYLDGKLLARFAPIDADEKGRDMVFCPEFPALCHALLDKALAELRIEPIQADKKSEEPK